MSKKDVRLALGYQQYVATWLHLTATGMLMALGACSSKPGPLSYGKGEYQGHYKIGNPYQIKGVWYVPKDDPTYEETGVASWYGPNFHGKQTANGEIFNQNALTAAHRTLPLPSMVRVTNLENGRTVALLVNDRGPYSKGRILDVSKKAADVLGFKEKGVTKVKVEFLPGHTKRLLADASLGEQRERALARHTGSSDRRPVQLASAARSTPATPSVKGAETSPSTKHARVTERDVPAAAPATSPRAKPSFPGISEAHAEAPSSARQKSAGPAHYVQAGAFGLFANAERTAERLKLFASSRIDSVQMPDRVLYRVQLGPFASREHAEQTLAQLFRSGFRDARVIED